MDSHKWTWSWLTCDEELKVGPRRLLLVLSIPFFLYLIIPGVIFWLLVRLGLWVLEGFNEDQESKIDAELADTVSKIKFFLHNQIETLAKEGQRVLFNEITIGYISHLIMLHTKAPVSVGVVQHTLTHIFTDKESAIMINNALQIFAGDRQTDEKLAALFPIAKHEYEAGTGEFLVRHTRKIRKAIDASFLPNPDFDPAKVPRWSAKDLA